MKTKDWGKVIREGLRDGVPIRFGPKPNNPHPEWGPEPGCTENMPIFPGTIMMNEFKIHTSWSPHWEHRLERLIKPLYSVDEMTVFVCTILGPAFIIYMITGA